MNNYWLIASATIGLLIIVVIVQWRLNKQTFSRYQTDIDALENDLKQRIEYNQQLLVNQAVTEGKLKLEENKASDYQQLQQQLISSKTESAALKIRLEKQTKNAQEKIKLLQNAENQLKTQFENLAHKIFEDRSKQFSEQNKTSMGISSVRLKSSWLILNNGLNQSTIVKPKTEFHYEKK